MRSNPGEYELVVPPSLAGVLALLSEQPGEWLPIAGGTDVMVQYAAGKLAARKLVSLWNLPELRRIEVTAGEVRIGAASTYSDLREHELIGREFPLLASCAGWTGGIANQNRGTLGGNIVNASPAADSLPALLAYEAALVLVSARGEHRVAYGDFHTGYKTMKLAPDELIQSICLPRRYAGYVSYSRKVGARNAQAISKVSIAALARFRQGMASDVRIAAGSVAPVPVRLLQTERLIEGNVVDDVLVQAARKTAAAEIRPIDDIRSSAAYRLAVLANLVGEFLEQLAGTATEVLARWNELPPEAAAAQVLPCCGSPAWARQLAGRRPLPAEAALLSASDQIWRQLQPGDWMEAFSKHPRIGERQAPPAAAAQSAAWSAEEQGQVARAADVVRKELAAGNRAYEERFGRVFIVCASGRSAQQMLEILRRRLQNDDRAELCEAAEEQRQITNLRLKKWLNP
jgi:OHCU decarboxylase